MKLISSKIATEHDERQRQLRDQWNRRIIASDKREIARANLDFSGRHWIEDTRTGEFFRVFGSVDSFYAGHCPAYYIDENGNAVLLERADPPSRDDLAKRRAVRDACRAARDAEPKERRARIRAGRT